MFILRLSSFVYRIIQKLHGTGNHIRVSLIVFIVLLYSINNSSSLTSAASPKAVTIRQSLAATHPSFSPLEKSDPANYSQIREAEVGEKKTDVKKSDASWGVARQIDEHSWTMQVEHDAAMGNSQEILSAINSYRQKKGVGSLSWNDTLAAFAQSRADSFSKSGKLDAHAGFQSMMDDNGFEKMGFNSLGENSSFGYILTGVHLIEWVYAGDKPHDDNQLRADWTHVGIGVLGTATDLVFGGKQR